MRRIPKVVTTSAMAALLASAALPAASTLESATPIPNAPSTPAVAGSALRDGRFAGRRVYTFYGFVQVEAVFSGGALTDVRPLEFPNHSGTSRYINSVALPYLIQEAVSSQSANVDIISGATLTSEAFARSLEAAIAGATR